MAFTAVQEQYLGSDELAVVDAPMPGTAGPGAGAAVFTDPSGRRSAWVGRALTVLTVLALGYLGVVATTLVRGDAAPPAAPHRPPAQVTEVPAPTLTLPLAILEAEGPATTPSK